MPSMLAGALGAMAASTDTLCNLDGGAHPRVFKGFRIFRLFSFLKGFFSNSAVMSHVLLHHLCLRARRLHRDTCIHRALLLRGLW